jgi:hypothetical protein
MVLFVNKIENDKLGGGVLRALMGALACINAPNSTNSTLLPDVVLRCFLEMLLEFISNYLHIINV